MSSSKDLPDAWDDDWVDNQASSSPTVDDNNAGPKKVSKSERRRQQYELNKKLWEEAETPEAPYFVQKHNEVPLQSGFAPQMKVLSRRPAPVAFVSKDPITGLEKRGAQDDHAEDEEEDAERQSASLSAEARAERARKDREEKQRRYDEVRQRLFGSTSADTTKFGGRSGGNGSHNQAQDQQMPERSGRGRGSQRKGPPARQLFDPNSTASREGGASSLGASTPMEGMPFRSPRGPDGSGRGGRGFTHRSGRGPSV